MQLISQCKIIKCVINFGVMFPNRFPEHLPLIWERNKLRKKVFNHTSIFSSQCCFCFVLMLHHRRKISKLWKGWISISKEAMFSGEVAKVWMEVTSCLSLVKYWKGERLRPFRSLFLSQNEKKIVDLQQIWLPTIRQAIYQSLIKQNSLWIFCMSVD